MRILFAILLINTSLLSCKKEKKANIAAPVKTYNQISKANWFMGNWENLAKEGAFHENWIQKTDSSFSGKSFVLVGKDTVFSEDVILEQKNDSLFYIVSAKNQNNEKPVSFYLSSATSKQLVFENPKHDFPSKIVYNKVGTDSIVAEIFGTQNQKEIKERFPMKKK
jgi:Domain of unknown function (DUF6265)